MAAVHTMASVGTLGMFIVDTFRFIDEAGIDHGDGGRGEVLGGGGLYCAIGARIWLPPSEVLAVIDQGNDFAASGYQATLDHYAQSSSPSSSSSRSALWKWRDRKDGTTKAVNVYRGEQRDFEYLTPKLRLDPIDLANGETGQLPRYLHAVCSPDRAWIICDQVDELDLKAYGSKGVTQICWEPIPDSAKPEHLKECLKVMARIAVLSPNHEEAASFLSLDQSLVAVPVAGVSPEQSAKCRASHLQHLAGGFRDRFLNTEGVEPEKCPLIVIRGGAAGATALQTGAGGQTITASIPAWHTNSEVSKVVDVTGGGNSFFGGFMAWIATNDLDTTQTVEERQAWLRDALCRGAVSASFIIEQLGLPTLDYKTGTMETWNGQSAHERLGRYQKEQ